MSDHDEDAIKTTNGPVLIRRTNWFKLATERTLWETRLPAEQESDSPFILPSEQNQTPAPAQTVRREMCSTIPWNQLL